jgi:hypothetical protein
MTTPCPHCCHTIPYKDVERLQEPYRSSWQGIIAWARDAVDRDMPIYPRDLERELHRLIDGGAVAVEAFALATTRYGREDENGE